MVMKVVLVVVLKLVGSGSGSSPSGGGTWSVGCAGSAGWGISLPARIPSASSTFSQPTLTRSANSQGMAKQALPAPHAWRLYLPSCSSPQTAKLPSMQAGSPLTVQSVSGVRAANSSFLTRAKARLVS